MWTFHGKPILPVAGTVLLLSFGGLTSAGVALGTEPGETVVAVENFAFTPASVTVVAGGSVTWEARRDPEQHTVTPTDEGAFAGSGSLFAGDDYTVKFDRPGRYAYVCSFHSFMTGIVVVEAAAASPEPTPGTASPPGSSATTSAPHVTAATATAAPAGEPTVDPGSDPPFVPLALLGIAVGVGVGFLLRRRSTTG